MADLLIVDDEKGYREVLSVVFAAEGYAVATAPHGRAAIAHLKKHPADLIISDVRMPDMDGIELLRRVRSIDSDIGVVMMSAFGTINSAREAFKLGADDFIQKPFNNEELKLIVARTLERRRLVSENRVLKQAQRKTGSLENIVGSSPKMAELFRLIETVAGERSTILITGESGTGKELVARAVHGLSDRAEKPFIPVNCGAMAESLLESELFGFMKGTFTGADQNRPGVFEAASGGTIFLDEISEMPLPMQVKMLRVLQEGRVRRIGSANEIEVDTRIIAATNRDLRSMVEDGTFRQDLFYRISVIPIEVPPLRDRREDIPDLIEHFVRKFSMRSAKTVRVGKDAHAALFERPWHGNVRELEHTIERAVALTADGGEICADTCAAYANRLRTVPNVLPADGIDLREHIRTIKHDLIEQALSRTKGNRTQAAKLLKLEPYQLRHLVESGN
ncbi:MAG: sigma-54 dependent transcriptional regulator [Pyrinomonadaceae bacterium]|nr:sigma-54 dependent transcriptional regulator [Pyrinomonadaceae bacterium]